MKISFYSVNLRINKPDDPRYSPSVIDMPAGYTMTGIYSYLWYLPLFLRMNQKYLFLILWHQALCITGSV
jgi:hypothetical protein